MKHARRDYDLIQDGSGKIPEDEPVFVLRGQDVYAAKIVRIYADMVEQGDGSASAKHMAKVCRDHANEMDEWKRHKRPDL